MPHYVRVGIREDRWYTRPHIPWLAPEELLADAFADLKTTDGHLSVYEVSDPADVQLIERIAAAVAAGKQKPEHTGYAVFRADAVQALGIKTQKTPGTTADGAVNALHVDLNELTTGKVVELAEVVAQGERRTILKKRVEELIKGGLTSGHLDRERLTHKWPTQL